MARIVVIGAGLTGVTAAWHLARDGHQVSVVERRDDIALETSFANGGQLSPSESIPWSGPHIAGLMMRWMFRRDAPFRLQLAADSRQWRWLLRFAVRCTADRRARGFRNNLALALYSLERIRQSHDLARRQGWRLAHDWQSGGILRVFRSPAVMRHAMHVLRPAREARMVLNELTPQQCVDLEPALRDVMPALAGGIHAPDDASGDAHQFAVCLAENARQAGVRFLLGAEVSGFESRDGIVSAVRVRTGNAEEEILAADEVVLAAGCWSPEIAGFLRLSLPIWPVMGYSVTLPAEAPHAPVISITDEENRLVISRLGDRLRAAGMAEIVRSLHAPLNPHRAEIVLTNLRLLFPHVGKTGTPVFWRGFRPMTPDSAPLVGRARGWRNLWLNTGHGSLGWTMAMGSAALLTDLMADRTPEIPSIPFNPARFR